MVVRFGGVGTGVGGGDKGSRSPVTRLVSNAVLVGCSGVQMRGGVGSEMAGRCGGARGRFVDADSGSGVPSGTFMLWRQLAGQEAA
jgi:hypothetical protein